VESKLADAKPLKEVLDDILAKSPSLQALFSKGYDLSNPFRSKLVGEQEEFEGKDYPTYFKLMSGHEEKQCHINQRFRVQFETDVVNDYFNRDRYPGRFTFKLNGNEFSDRVFNLWNGVATLTASIPEGTEIEDRLKGQVWVMDDTQIEPFYCEFYRNVLDEIKPNGGPSRRRKPPAGNDKGNRKTPEQLSLPQVVEVKEEEWHRHDFDRFSALKVINDGKGSYDFFVNIDNVFLKTEIKSIRQKDKAPLLEARFKYGLILIGLSMLKDREILEDSSDEQDERETIPPIEVQVLEVTRAIAPIILPMIETLGSLDIDEVITDKRFELELE
jgi:hypothetical protein